MIFWVRISSGVVNSYRCFSGINCLHLQCKFLRLKRYSKFHRNFGIAQKITIENLPPWKLKSTEYTIYSHGEIIVWFCIHKISWPRTYSFSVSTTWSFRIPNVKIVNTRHDPGPISITPHPHNIFILSCSSLVFKLATTQEGHNKNSTRICISCPLYSTCTQRP